ncbi:hypothetical protein BOX15_Mlig022186g3 [Macrostomum lignano]|uniref:peptidylamidoglycolate lyase n=2 Tax=Macrostomum lignano TaxID=282301 RepID=A0A1I8HRY2_9PLAT|nr:hypothetical protein BOX15_Mlig022186g3 [Macrostomum lignano]
MTTSPGKRLLLPAVALLLPLLAVAGSAPHHEEPAGHHRDSQRQQNGLSVSFQEGFPNWRLRQLLGQVSGVSICAKGRSFLFQRADRPWQADDFDEHERYTKAERGPIEVSTIIELDSVGRLVSSIGENIFYLPHGITVDKDGHLWTTDVARHQVIRLNKDTRKPDLVIGEKFVPGNDASHFCKPTKVAVASDGHFFVADGYCNSRVMKFDPSGKYIGEFGKRPSATPGANLADNEFLVPHGLALFESLDLLCVADREHRRVQCFHAGLRQPADFGQFVRSLGSADDLGRVFDVAFDPSGNLLVLHHEDSGVSLVSVFRPETGGLVTRFTFVPDNSQDSMVGFGDGHSVAASPRGDFFVVSSLSAVCDGYDEECFGEMPTQAPYQVFKFNVDQRIPGLM